MQPEHKREDAPHPPLLCWRASLPARILTSSAAGRVEPRCPRARCVFPRQSVSLTLDLPPLDTSVWRAVVRVLRSTADNLSCTLFPSCCALCGHALLRLSRVPICDDCWNCLLPQSGSLCVCCGEDFGPASFSTPRLSSDDPRFAADLLCHLCRQAPPAFVQAVAYGVYQGRLRSLIHLLKYDGMRPVAQHLGRLLARSIESFTGFSAAPLSPGMLVVPVPLYAARLRQRGFNHAALLARAAIAEMRRRRHPRFEFHLASGMLERRRPTASQAGLTARQRRQNLRGAFSAPRPAALAGRQVLLVDDVYTTGATARACSRVLIDAGAASVRVATVARAQREGIAFWDAPFASRPTGPGQDPVWNQEE
jgi:ComF family protein